MQKAAVQMAVVQKAVVHKAAAYSAEGSSAEGSSAEGSNAEGSSAEGSSAHRHIHKPCINMHAHTCKNAHDKCMHTLTHMHKGQYIIMCIHYR